MGATRLGESVTLYLGDCLDVMRDMPTGSVDAVVTDPPYYGREDLFSTECLPLALDAILRFEKVLMFWPCNTPMPARWPDAVHVWDKTVPIHPHSQIGHVAGHHYEQILAYGVGRKCLTYRVAAIMPNFRSCRSELTEHPTQKPLELLTALIGRFVPQHATVLDPFMGSGTTGVACVQTGRNFIGIEIDPTYYAIAERRIAEAQMQPSLDGMP